MRVLGFTPEVAVADEGVDFLGCELDLGPHIPDIILLPRNGCSSDSHSAGSFFCSEFPLALSFGLLLRLGLGALSSSNPWGVLEGTLVSKLAVAGREELADERGDLPGRFASAFPTACGALGPIVRLWAILTLTALAVVPEGVAGSFLPTRSRRVGLGFCASTLA